MKRSRTALAVGFTFALACAVSADQKISMNDLPPAVRESIQREIQGATLKNLAREIETGKTFYEAETLHNGRNRDLLFDATGLLVEVEEQIPIDEAPTPVRIALTARGKILRLESVTKGSRVTYEAVVEKNGKKGEVAVDGNGKPVRP